MSVAFHSSITKRQERAIEIIQSTCLKVILGESLKLWECTFENWLENIETEAGGEVSRLQLEVHKTSTAEATFPLQ